MLKQVVLIKRRPDLTRQQFIDYYENHHSKLAEKVIPLARHYVRRYVVPEWNPLTNKHAELDFDVVMEIWWDSREDFDASMKQIAGGDLIKMILEDEDNFMDGHNHRSFTVEEHVTKLPNSISQ